MVRILLLSLLFALAVPVSAQAPFCGTPDPTPEQLAKFRKMPRNYLHGPLLKSNYPLRKLPVRFHIVARSNGSGGIPPDTLREELKRINMIYALVGIEFFFCEEPDTIKEDILYDFSVAEASHSKIQSKLDNNTIDVFFFNSIMSSNVALCGYTYFPGGPDYIMMANSCVNGTTLGHELGHYFTLYHTHGSTNFGSTNELVDGSNCDVAGDEICDTPADPNLQFLVDSNCNYTGVEKDANELPYQPMVNNIMSYSRKHCRNMLTAMQYGRIREGYEFERSYLCCSAPLLKYGISQSGNTITYIDSSDYATSSNWDFGDGYTSVSMQGQHTYSQPGEYTITLMSNNDCGSGIVKIQLKLLGLYKVQESFGRLYPNPARDRISIELDDQYSFVIVEIYDLAGKKLNTRGIDAPADKLDIDGAAFPGPGLYLIKLMVPGKTQWMRVLMQ